MGLGFANDGQWYHHAELFSFLIRIMGTQKPLDEFGQRHKSGKMERSIVCRIWRLQDAEGFEVAQVNGGLAQG